MPVLSYGTMLPGSTPGATWGQSVQVRRHWFNGLPYRPRNNPGGQLLRGDCRSFRLLYEARNPGTLAGLERLRDLQSRLDLIICCVVDEGLDGSGYSTGPINTGHTSRILEGVPANEVTALVCGPAGMMEVATDALLAAGMLARSIHYERFDFGGGKGRLDKARRRDALLPFLALVVLVAVFSLR